MPYCCMLYRIILHYTVLHVYNTTLTSNCTVDSVVYCTCVFTPVLYYNILYCTVKCTLVVILLYKNEALFMMSKNNHMYNTTTICIILQDR